MRFRALTMLFSLLLGVALLCPAVLAQSTTAPPPNAAPAPQDTAKPDAVKLDDSPTAAPQAQKQPDTQADQVPAEQTQAPAATSEKDKKQEAQAPGDYKHDGGKDDVDSIGNRKMGGRGLGNWYSLEKEIRIGKEYAQMVEQSVKLNTDPVVNEYVNRIGQNLVRNSDAKVPFTIKVIDSDEINAFALPGGFFYVNTGLVMAADEEAELAGVMSHEIAHVAARHATRQATRGQIANLASIPLIFVGGGLGYGVRTAVGLLLPMTFFTFSRGFESEADYLGVQYMYKAGYDPQAFVSFFEKVQAKEKKKPGTLAKAFATHPQTPDRIGKTQEEIARILPPRDQYVVTTSEFDDVKARLAALQNRRQLTDQKDNRPSLRRSNTSKTTDDKDKKDDDDRPTLK
ncbi:MAG: M48 family metallopeptidase, partial [Acidobacteriota bacterium]|nr:M48 family metallopeptidase [Acidobacteriota bacterium]